MDLIIVKVPRGFTLCVGSGVRWSSCNAVVAIFPRAGWHADEVLSALVHDDNLTIQAPLSCVLATVAQMLCPHCHGGEASELDEPPPAFRE
jgi:hypothetical protein